MCNECLRACVTDLKVKPPTNAKCCLFSKWCGRRDSNPHAKKPEILSLLCLPFHHARG